MTFFSNIKSACERPWLWFKEYAKGKNAARGLAGLSFIETIFFPFPVDPLLVAIVLAQKQRWMHFALVATVASCLGAVVGYAIGLFAFDTVGMPLLSFLHVEEAFMRFRDVFNESGFLLMFAAALTPIPNVVILAGLFKMNFVSFLVAWVVGRVLRFYGVAYIVYAFGSETFSRLDRWLNIGTVIFALLFLGWFVMKLLALPV